MNRLFLAAAAACLAGLPLFSAPSAAADLAGTYRYAEQDASGEAVIARRGSGFTLTVTTFVGTNMCEFEGACRAAGNGLVCTSGEATATLIPDASGKSFELSLDGERSDFCGMNAYFQGRYRRK